MEVELPETPQQMLAAPGLAEGRLSDTVASCMLIDLAKTDHAGRRVRRHRITLQLTLLGGCDVVCSWWWARPHPKAGRRETRQRFDSLELGEREAVSLARARLQQGYRLLQVNGIDARVLEPSDD